MTSPAFLEGQEMGITSMDNPSFSLSLSVCTYNGSYFSSKVDSGIEYADPMVPVLITQSGSFVYLDLGVGVISKDVTHPAIQIERQTDRWSMLVLAEHDGDGDVIVEILDDGTVNVTRNYPEYLQENVHITEEVAPHLPEDKLKFGIPEAVKKSRRKKKEHAE
jgi:hypothetical protein